MWCCDDKKIEITLKENIKIDDSKCLEQYKLWAMDVVNRLLMLFFVILTIYLWWEYRASQERQNAQVKFDKQHDEIYLEAYKRGLKDSPEKYKILYNQCTSKTYPKQGHSK